MRLPFTKLVISLLLFLLSTAYLFIYISTDIRRSRSLDDTRPFKAETMLSPPSPKNSGNKIKSLPGTSHEILQRRAIQLIRESGYLINSAFNEWNKSANLPAEGGAILARFNEIALLLEADVEGISRVDDSATAKRLELTRLGENFQKRLKRFQNPVSCKKNKFLIVNFNKACGFGCQMHHVVHCFVLAYANNRILIMGDDRWSYLRSGFTSVFEPLSNCSSVHSSTAWSDPLSESAPSIKCPEVEAMPNLPPYAHPAVPADLSSELSRVHGAPHVWFVGQLLSYVMRIKKGEISKSIENIVASLHKSPVVGLHVRRTDKISTEAQLHELEEYMSFADRYFDKNDAQRLLVSRTSEWVNDELSADLLRSSQRCFYLATDEPKLLSEARLKYPNSIFIGDSARALSAQLNSRYTDNGLLSILTDVIALSRTDFLVCTFSSQVCRLAYELMQTQSERLGDASARFKSLDDVYYYGGQQEAPYEVIVPDATAGLHVGDLVKFHGNHWNGLAKVSKVNSPETMLLPAYKFQRRILSVPFGPHLHEN